MFRRVAYLAVSAGMLMLVGGCALNFLSGERRESWRDAEERACIRSGVVAETAYIQQVKEINGRGACGIDRPLKVYAFAGGRVSMGPSSVLGCPMTAALERWLQTSVQPAAIAWFGMPIVELKQMGTYSCRTRNNIHGARLSEHAFGNALDIGGFKLANGRVVRVKGEFLYGAPDAQGFLREVFAGACAQFKTVLGPGAPYHGDHFHLDLAHHNAAGTSRYCKPTPSVPPPVRPPYRGDQMASYPPAQAPGPLLAQAPPDVAADTNDPFGVAATRERRVVAAAGPVERRPYAGPGTSDGVPPGITADDDTYGPGGMPAEGDSSGQPALAGDTYAQDGSTGDAYGQPTRSGEGTYGQPDSGYTPAPPAPEVSIAAVPPPEEWRSPPARRKQGFLSWFFKPKPPADIPLSYAPEQ
jgi:hypothetical protein